MVIREAVASESRPAATEAKAMFSWIRPISRGWRICSAENLIVAAAFLLAATPATSPSHAQAPATPIRIDASRPAQEPDLAQYDEGSATAPNGDTLGLNSRYLMRNGKPWLPVMGEIHFSRVPRERWEEEILKMKAAGVDIVSTYVFWIHHEEVEGHFDWNGQRDLRAFAQLCARHGMMLQVRIGPWDHGEVRNGGLPDWVLKQGPTRVNDPIYLASVHIWYAQIAAQLKGLLWKDGGPVIGVQLENEYSKRGPGAGEAHILELKRIAVACGFDVPFYIVTGWDNASVPPRAVLPVYGGYPDAPWDSSITKLPPDEVYAFRSQSRVTAGAAEDSTRLAPDTKTPTAEQLPFLTAELGGGIEDTYHRRPVIAPDDIAATVPVMLGSGVNLYGTYMFQGGTNPDGALSTLQESQDTGYPNDLPIKSYDFQAPLGEFGEERAALRKLKVFQYFLNDFGAELAPMTVSVPEMQPRNPADFSVARASVRSSGNYGFIFCNNYVRGYVMPARPAAQFLIRLPHGELAVPRHPIDLPSGAYFIWPFNFNADGITLRYSTAQLFARVADSGINTLYFEAVRGIPVEFAFDATTVRTLKASSGETLRDSGTMIVSGFQPGVESSIDALSAQGNQVRIVVLTAHEAENAWKVRLGGSDHLLITDQDLVADRDAQPGQIWLRSRGAPRFAFTLTPPIASPLKANLPLALSSTTSGTSSFSAEAPSWSVPLEYHQIQTAGTAPPVKLGPAFDWRPNRVAQAPGPGDLPQAAEWEITVPEGSLTGLSELFLQIDYQGDVARLTANHRLLDDDFYNGKPWLVGIRRFLAPQGPSTFELSILPLREDAPVYFELGELAHFGSSGQIDKVDDIRLIPEYQLEITPGESLGRKTD